MRADGGEFGAVGAERWDEERPGFGVGDWQRMLAGVQFGCAYFARLAERKHLQMKG